MSLLADVQKFISDLVLGDFAEDPSTASIVVNGAIGLIPIVDQVLDARDVTAQILICFRKGWDQMDEDDYANLAFTAIGLVPSFGSFFKGAVKPLWRQRKFAGRGVQGGVAMLERALGMSKGGVIRWIHAIQWVERRQQAAQTAQAALNAYIGLLEVVASGPWWAPDALVRRAKWQLPDAQRAKFYVSHAVERGGKLIEDFVKDLLGEHAVWVQAAASLATAAVQTGHQGAGSHKVTAKASATATNKRKAQGKDSSKGLHGDDHPQVGNQKQKHAKAETSPVSVAQDPARKFIETLGARPMALLAEHMVDYHVLDKEGVRYEHGSLQVHASGFSKVNAPYRPNELIAEDWSRVFTRGIDSLWQRPNGRYLVVEAKGRIGAPSTQTEMTQRDVDKGNSKIPPIPPGVQLTEKQAQLWRMLHDNSDKGGAGAVMQMSDEWIEKDIRRTTGLTISKKSYDRRVYLVSQFKPAANGLPDHLDSIDTAIGAHAIDHALHQSVHGVSEEYLEQDILVVQNARKGRNASQKRTAAQTKNDSTPRNRQAKGPR